MLLYLMRHGEAIDRNHPDCPSEEDRFLTDEGKEKTLRVAEGLEALEVNLDLAISSPLRRAVQTAGIAAEELGLQSRAVRKTDALDGSLPPEVLLEELAEIGADSVLCVGHTPHLDEIIACLLDCDETITKIKKAGVACLDVETFNPPSAILLWLMTPDALTRIS